MKTASDILLNAIYTTQSVEASPELMKLNWYKQILARPNHHPMTEYQVREFIYLEKKYNQIKFTVNAVRRLDIMGQAGKLSI